MLQDMRLRGLAARTQESYLEAVISLVKQVQRSPDQITDAELRGYLIHLTQVRNLSAGSLRIHRAGLRFFYERTLGELRPALELFRVRQTRRLPVILSRTQVQGLFREVRRPGHRWCLTLMYVCGLRATEATELQVTHIDGSRKILTVRGKGGKERQVPLPEPTLQGLREYWRACRPQKPWLFPDRTGLFPVGVPVLRKCLTAAAWSRGIDKQIGCHTLRHSYATHLLEKGVDLRVIQGLLGHQSPRTTFLYLHLTPAMIQSVHQVVDDLADGL
jgi:site-specific recombinase XerD